MQNEEFKNYNEINEPTELIDIQGDIKPPQSKKKRNNILPIVIILILIAGVTLAVIYKDKIFKSPKGNTIQNKNYKSEYRLSGNALENFDLYFLQLENNSKNIVYSPLSIKYALEMLSEGASGDSKKQLDAVIGDYAARKYMNSKNMSFANAMFIRDSFKTGIKTEYTDLLKNKYNAEVKYDSFESPKNINNWVNQNTFKLIPELLDNVSDNDFILINALAIDMEWVKKIQPELIGDAYSVEFPHEEFSTYVGALENVGYTGIDFEGYSKQAKSALINAVANKYDIVKELGESQIRKTVGSEYKKWLQSDEVCSDDEPDVETFLNQYMKEINSSYKHISSSTDFYFEEDDELKIFAKDLKEYDGVTLQYVGIMPKKDKLNTFIKNINANKLNEKINNLKTIDLVNFDDKTITYIKGNIPMFNFAYELNLMNDLKQLGIEDVFDPAKSNLENMTSVKNTFINKAAHKANIEFSNDGIKAAAATAIGGLGAADCNFDYIYKVPVKEIDLTFNKPFMFIIRDKKTKETWFTGAVYEPVEITSEEDGENYY